MQTVQIQTKSNQEAQLLVPNPKVADFVVDTGVKESQDQEYLARRDMDEESTTQNFMNIAKQGKLSPRHIEQGKSAAKEKKRNNKEQPIVATGGVKTRRGLSKNQNL